MRLGWIIISACFLCLVTNGLSAQIIQTKPVDFKRYATQRFLDSTGNYKRQFQYLDKVQFQQIIYKSDSFEVIGFIISNKNKPFIQNKLLVYNKGGNNGEGKEKHQLSLQTLADLAYFTQHGFSVILSNYRGSFGSTGKDEFGGADVDDIDNLLKAIDAEYGLDLVCIAMLGFSRGGMMSYFLTLTLFRLKRTISRIRVQYLQGF